MSIRPRPMSRHEFKLGLDNARLFKGIVSGDLAMLNHITDTNEKGKIFYFAGRDVYNILEMRNSVHQSKLEQNLLDSPTHIRLRQFILAGGLTLHYDYGAIQTQKKLTELPVWIKKEAGKILLNYAIGTYGAIKNGQANVRELNRVEFKNHLDGIIKTILRFWNPSELGSKLGENGHLGRNALYDVLLAKQDVFISAYGAV